MGSSMDNNHYGTIAMAMREDSRRERGKKILIGSLAVGAPAANVSVTCRSFSCFFRLGERYQQGIDRCTFLAAHALVPPSATALSDAALFLASAGFALL